MDGSTTIQGFLGRYARAHIDMHYISMVRKNHAPPHTFCCSYTAIEFAKKLIYIKMNVAELIIFKER